MQGLAVIDIPTKRAKPAVLLRPTFGGNYILHPFNQNLCFVLHDVHNLPLIKEHPLWPVAPSLDNGGCNLTRIIIMVS